MLFFFSVALLLFAVLSYNSLGFHNQAPCHSSPSALRAIEAMKSDSREQARMHSSRTQTTGVEKTEERLESEKDCAAFFSFLYSCHYPFPLFGWFFFFFLTETCTMYAIPNATPSRECPLTIFSTSQLATVRDNAQPASSLYCRAHVQATSV